MSSAKNRSDIRRLLDRVADENLSARRLPELLTAWATPTNAWRLRASIARDANLRTDAVAGDLAYFYEQNHDCLAPTTALNIVDAAIIASGASRDAALRSTIWKHRATILGSLARFGEAEEALGHAEGFAKQALDATFHLIGVKFGRAVLAYARRRNDEAAQRLAEVIKGYDQLGLSGNAAVARNFLACVEYRRKQQDPARLESMLIEAQRELNEAERRGDVNARAGHMGRVGAVTLQLGRYDEALFLLRQSAALCAACGMVTVEARVQRLLAQLAMRQGDVHGGMVAMRRNRRRFLDLGMPAEATISLVDAVDTLLDVAPRSPEIVPLCRTIQTEASRLDLRVDAALATERLIEAAIHGNSRGLTHAVVRAVRDAIDPMAGYTNQSIPN